MPIKIPPMIEAIMANEGVRAFVEAAEGAERMTTEVYEAMRQQIEKHTDLLLLENLLHYTFQLEKAVVAEHEKVAEYRDKWMQRYKPTPEVVPEAREYVPKRSKDRHNRLLGRVAIPQHKVIDTYAEEMGVSGMELDAAQRFYAWLRE